MPPMTTEQLQQFLASADGQQLLQTVLTPTPEYNNARGGYMQPSDVGSQIANMSLIEDIFNAVGGDVGLLMSLIGGQFDYGLLEPVSSFDEAAPDTALADQYRASGKYDVLFQSLAEGYLPNDAALAQFNHEHTVRGAEAPKVDLTREKNDPHYMDLVEMAKEIAPQVAAQVSYEQRRDAAPSSPSPMGERFEEMGFSSASVTPDNHYSDNIDQLRAERDGAQSDYEAEMARIQGFENQLIGGEGSFDGVREELKNADAQWASQEFLRRFDEAEREKKLADERSRENAERVRRDVVDNDPVAGNFLTRDWSQTPVQEYEPVVRGVNDAGSDNPLATTFSQDEASEMDFFSRPRATRSNVPNYAGNWRQMDRAFEDSLKRRGETDGYERSPADKAAARRAFKARNKASDEAYFERRRIERERASGRTIQSDQASARLANFLMGL